MVTTSPSNAPAAIRARAGRGLVRVGPVGTVLVLRTLLAFAVAGAASAIALIAHSADPIRAAAQWWIVTATVIDIGCLAALVIAVRREGIRLRDLVGYRGPRDVVWIPVAMLVLAPGLALSSLLTSLSYPPASPPEVSVVALPPLAGLYAVAVWPIIWTATEELVYLGYLLPRLEVLRGRGVAVALVLLFWSLQHLALPFLPDAQYLVHRFITALPVVVAVTLAYFLVGRRLVPLIVMHWLGDLFTAVLAVSSPG